MKHNFIKTDSRFMTISVYDYLYERYEENDDIIEYLENVFAESTTKAIEDYAGMQKNREFKETIYVFYEEKPLLIMTESSDINDLYDTALFKNHLYLDSFNNTLILKSNEYFDNSHYLKKASNLTEEEKEQLKEYAVYMIGDYDSDFYKNENEYTKELNDFIGIELF